MWEWQSHLGFQASLVTWAYDNLLTTKQEEGEEGRRKGQEKGERRASLCRALAKVRREDRHIFCRGSPLGLFCVVGMHALVFL